MSDNYHSDWTNQKERVSSFWLKLILNIALMLPRNWVKLLLHPIVCFYLLISRNQIIASRHYLNQALGRPATIRDVYRHFFWFATTILDRVYFLSGRHSAFNITYENREKWKESMQERPTQLYFGAHFGSLDAVRFLSQEIHNIKIKAVVKVDQNERIMKIFNELNPELQSGIIPNDGMNTIFDIYDALKTGSSVAILKDRSVSQEKTVEVQFFKDKIRIPISGFKLAQKRNIPVTVFFGRYEGKNHYHVFSKPLDFCPDMAIEEMAQLYISEVEAQCRISPYNWFNFYHYWVGGA
ncbi:LpxL/LpxP family acyltransferase [Hydrogenovibrio kuenenii]|uniref:LpxL/LpxP family acyltransferase n=1 Tax=Hydrogenovibrio kuenenii TaxID=63658 RepID=UPI000464516F|nr:hypothetical protein [Hydrogenovibrio kuenenii]